MKKCMFILILSLCTQIIGAMHIQKTAPYILQILLKDENKQAKNDFLEKLKNPNYLISDLQSRKILQELDLIDAKGTITRHIQLAYNPTGQVKKIFQKN
ncbi:MAG: hypothetical protein BWY54_00207 [Candidatus Dependentiae bacterium ADurb.Bin331]|nr:MAG: hypothetical protein BWY54_00207 [Candidatus Dependentiae bacterium ADurb.Bin331]